MLKDVFQQLELITAPHQIFSSKVAPSFHNSEKTGEIANPQTNFFQRERRTFMNYKCHPNTNPKKPLMLRRCTIILFLLLIVYHLESFCERDEWFLNKINKEKINKLSQYLLVRNLLYVKDDVLVSFPRHQTNLCGKDNSATMY